MSTSLTLKEWEDLGKKVKSVHADILKITLSYKKGNKFTRNINKLIRDLKNELDNQVCNEYEGDNITKIFYGQIE